MTPKIAKKGHSEPNLGLSKACNPNFIPVVVLKNCGWTFINISWTLQYISKEALLSILLEGLIGGSHITYYLFLFPVGERSAAKNSPVCLLSVVSFKTSRKLVNNRLDDHIEKCGLFLISSTFLGLLDQLQLYLIELLGVLTGLGLCKL